ncbi:hypothetical protein BDDG_06905 [Blastomyces dermatitidis ATCC 18188]|uniref:Uncharacterized protein n=1 Tax=Ajellomyces dermatitidis (strain ATCC 18188 / CBS 674.68) TaxID=653446 RepID=F2TL47_AJEDA|nr:hypothetical protein BDDG_06905 [Blastomyces dermatitidis ATCC 18188]
MAAKVQHSGDQQQQSSAKSQKVLSLDSTTTRPTSPVPATRLWESAAHSYVYCEETPAGKAIHITLSTLTAQLSSRTLGQYFRILRFWSR